VLDGGRPLLETGFPSAGLGADPSPLLDALLAHGPFDLVLGPAGYGLPLVPVADVGESELALMVLKRADEPETGAGIAGMRSIVRCGITAPIKGPESHADSDRKLGSDQPVLLLWLRPACRRARGPQDVFAEVCRVGQAPLRSRLQQASA